MVAKNFTLRFWVRYLFELSAKADEKCNYTKTILAGTSPRIIKSSEIPNTSTNTDVFSTIGVQPRIILSDLSNKSYIQSDNQEIWCNNSDNYINIKPCQVKLSDIFQQDPMTSHCHISKCGNKKCKTCYVLNTGSSFIYSHINKSNCTRSFDGTNCKTSNLIYGITCSRARVFCGLIYVGEPKG